FIQAWYQGGISVIDFTDSTNPIEIAYFDRGPIDEKELLTGGFWSVYYYQGAIYGTEIARGLDVLKLLPSEFLSANEIAAAALAYPAMGPSKLFNPQQQIPMAWPDMPIVASAYVDQFERAKAISSVTADNVRQLLSKLAELIKTNKSSKVGEVVFSIKKEMKSVTADQTTVDRFQRTLEGIASQSLASI
ncbi:MAG: DUF305 domain-containing protein, partial [Porticoccaceae bacterium]|nr:DUF305 domain-containing protein [Porticoccaceae bacterium]